MLMTDLERTSAELRAAVIRARKRIVKLNFGRRNDPALLILRRVLRESREQAAPGRRRRLGHVPELNRRATLAGTRRAP
jgi:hypothetical protein